MNLKYGKHRKLFRIQIIHGAMRMRKAIRIGINILGLLLIKIIPIKKGRFVFTSFDGHYSDSPKCISEVMHEMNPDVEIIWLVSRERIEYVPKRFKAVDIKSKRRFWYLGTAQVLVDNVYGNKEFALCDSGKFALIRYKINCFLRKKKGQLMFTTWHGTPLKKIGRDQVNSRILDFSCFNSVMICENRYIIDIMARITFNSIKTVLLGMPRNDVLVAYNEEKYRETKERLGIPAEKKCILFAPTFRNNGNDISDINADRSGINQLADISGGIDKLFECLKNKFGGEEWILICRFHYHAEKKIDWESLKRKYDGRIINGNINDDMSDYLLCADVLLTDVSSCMFDFSLSGKPCFLFFPDADYYIKSERGLYYPIEKLPFPMSESFDGLLEHIENFDEKIYKEKLEKMISEFGYISSGNASGKAAEYILAESGNAK